jgi:hypothetical protein
VTAPSVLLAEVRAAGVHLALDGGALRVRVPKGVLTAAQREQLTAHRAEIAALLAEPAADRTHRDMSRPVPPVAVDALPVDLMLAFEERAALAEFDGGLDRAAAERLAWDEVIGEAEP